MHKEYEKKTNLENTHFLKDSKIILIEGDYDFGNKKYIELLKQSSLWPNIIYIKGSVSKVDIFSKKNTL
jgi:hypothetical protein